MPDRSGLSSAVRGIWPNIGAAATIMREAYEVFFIALLLRLFVGSRPASEQIASIRQLDASSIQRCGAVLCAIAFHHDLGSRRKIGLSQALPQQGIRRSELNGPIHYLAAVVLDVHVQPRVRIDPVHRGERSLDGDELLRVILGGEGVMSK